MKILAALTSENVMDDFEHSSKANAVEIGH
jgi:hypothetical protein